MSGTWYQNAKKLLHWGRQAAPVAISLGLVGWLIWTISPEALLEALSTWASPWLVLATLGQLVVLFLCDALTMWWLYSLPDRPLSFRTVLRARLDTTLWMAVNQQLGMALFAYRLSGPTRMSAKETLGRCIALGLCDFGILLALGLAGSFLRYDPVIDVLRWICVGCLSGILALVLIVHFLPASWRDWLAGWEGLSWLGWWSWRHSFWLVLQRLILFLLLLLYAGVCLAICGFPADVRTVVGVIPFVLLAESLPSTGGLGNREFALVYLLKPSSGEQRALLLAFGLIWSTVVMLGRIAIGVAAKWIPLEHHSRQQRPAQRPTAAKPSS